MHSRHGVSVFRTLFEPALLELQRGPIELIDQFGVPLPQPFLGQELGGQTLEPRDEPAVVGIHAATPLLPPPRPRGVGSCEERGPTDSARQRRYAAQRSNTREVSCCFSPVPARILPAQIPGRLTASGLVGSARIALPIHFARPCGAFTTYRRISFSLASAISGGIAALGV